MRAAEAEPEGRPARRRNSTLVGWGVRSQIAGTCPLHLLQQRRVGREPHDVRVTVKWPVRVSALYVVGRASNVPSSA